MTKTEIIDKYKLTPAQIVHLELLGIWFTETYLHYGWIWEWEDLFEQSEKMYKANTPEEIIRNIEKGYSINLFEVSHRVLHELVVKHGRTNVFDQFNGVYITYDRDGCDGQYFDNIYDAIAWEKGYKE